MILRVLAVVVLLKILFYPWAGCTPRVHYPDTIRAELKGTPCMYL